MININSIHVDRITRQWLRQWHLEAYGEDFVADIETVLTHHRERNLSGLVYDAALILGLPQTRPTVIASACEMIYCAVGMIDDIQDGDVDDYLPGDVGQQINVALTLRELGARRLSEAYTNGANLLAIQISQATLQMTASQREELTAKAAGYASPWDVAAYERVARRAAGAELALFLFAVGLAADADGAGGVRRVPLSHTLRDLGYTLGVLLQIRVDCATGDERIAVLPTEAVDDLRQRYAGIFENDARGLPEKLVALLAGVAGIGDENVKGTNHDHRQG